MSIEAKRAYSAYLKSLKGYKSAIETAHIEGRDASKKDGFAEGFAEGFAKGKKEGKAELKVDVIINGFKNGLSISLLSAITELTEKEVEDILKKHQLY